jgi:hypothetical protein
MASTKFVCKHGTTDMLNTKNCRTSKNGITMYLACEKALGIVLEAEVLQTANASFQARESYKKSLGHSNTMLYAFVETSNRILIPKLGGQHPARIWVALGKSLFMNAIEEVKEAHE